MNENHGVYSVNLCDPDAIENAQQKVQPGQNSETVFFEFFTFIV